MKRSMTAAVFAVIVLTLLGSCDAFFVNVFKGVGLGQVTPEGLAGMDAAQLVEESGLLTGTISDSFFNAWAGSTEDEKAGIRTHLEGALQSEDPAEVQAALALLVELQLSDAGAGQIVDNVLETIVTIATQEGGFDPESLPAMLRALIPSAMADEHGAITAAIDALADSYGLLTELAGTIGESGEFDANLEAGDLAATAVLAAFLDFLDPAADYPTIGAAVEAAYKDETGASPETFFSVPPDADPLAYLGSDGTLTTLLTAAGLGGLFDSF